MCTGSCQISDRLVPEKVLANPQVAEMTKPHHSRPGFSSLTCPVSSPILIVVVFECRQKDIGAEVAVLYLSKSENL